MQIGIVGLPLSGKTTVFNALSKGHEAVDSFAGGKRESHIGVVKVPDMRLAKLAEMFKPKKVTPTSVQYVDVVGLEKGASKKGGFSDEFLGNLRTVDALLLVLRLYENENVLHPENSIEPERDLSIVETEFLLSDMSIVENRIIRLEKTIPKTKIPDEIRELEVLRRCSELLNEERPLREIELSHDEEKLIRGYQFLTIKPLLVVLNIGEEHLGTEDDLVRKYSSLGQAHKCALTTICAEIEMEIEQLDEEDQQAFLEDMGIKELALSRLVRASHDLLGLVTFFTYVHDEIRAWNISLGTPAKLAAGAVHTDMERGFIRAEVVSFEDLTRCKTIAHCREEGLLRLEGKDYAVQDGDVITFRFNV
jgi:GTP-binding protein YchF